MSALKAGRELDALVAEKMGDVVLEETLKSGRTYTVYSCGSGKRPSGHTHPLPYSTDIAAAWLVWERFPAPKRLQENWIDDEGGWASDYDADQRWWCSLDVGREYGPATDLNAKTEAYAETAPMAICLAALKAVGVDSDVIAR